MKTIKMWKKMKNLLKKQGFTLVELIIVIAIIAVLAVAAFMMLTKWLGKSRDSRKVADIETISKSLMIWMNDLDNSTGLVPHPDNEWLTQWDGVTFFTQWVFGSGVVSELDNMQKAPLNPSTNGYYTYSRTENGKKYQIATELEDGSQTTALVESVAAWVRINKVRWNFTPGIYLFETWANYIAFYLPAIVTAAGMEGVSVNLAVDQSFVMDGQTKNLVESLGTVTQYRDMSAEVTTPLAVLWSGPAADIWGAVFVSAITTSLSGMVVEEVNTESVTGLLWVSGIEVDNTPSSEPTVTSTCNESTKPVNTSGQIEYTNNPSSENQSYVQDSLECWYSCTGWYTGSDCNDEPISSPTNLSLTHISWYKTFTFSWTAGADNGASCKLQYLKDGTIWTNISETTYNCDTDVSIQSVTLPWDGWNGDWNSVSVRVIRTSDSSLMGTFTQNLTCSSIVWSSTSTLNIDENCDGEWDDSIGGWIFIESDPTYDYGLFCGWWWSQTAGWTSITDCKTWATWEWYDHFTALYYGGLTPYYCYWNTTNCTDIASDIVGSDFTEALHYEYTDALYY